MFEETIEKDIAFGPGKLKISQDEIKNRVIKAMESVGLDYEFYKDKSPFELSGGQKRRVAIAGVIAMEPEVLILDEPTAGVGSEEVKIVTDLIKRILNEMNMTIIFTEHDLDVVFGIAYRVIVMNRGKIIKDGNPAEVRQDEQVRELYGLGKNSSS